MFFKLYTLSKLFILTGDYIIIEMFSWSFLLDDQDCFYDYSNLVSLVSNKTSSDTVLITLPVDRVTLSFSTGRTTLFSASSYLLSILDTTYFILGKTVSWFLNLIF